MNLARHVMQSSAHVWADSPEQRVHLVLKSGRHSNGYINSDPASVSTSAMWLLAGELTHKFLETAHNNGLKFNGLPFVVATPPWGSFRLADYFAIQLQMLLGEAADMVIIEKNDAGVFYIDREGHPQALDGANVIIIEDVSTTGKSTREVIALVESYGGTVVTVGSVWNRGAVTAADLLLDGDKVVTFTLIDEQLADWAAKDCPLCTEKVPIATDLGHGTKFQTEHPDYLGGFTTLRG